jgi:hypothetical protein
MLSARPCWRSRARAMPGRGRASVDLVEGTPVAAGGGCSRRVIGGGSAAPASAVVMVVKRSGAPGRVHSFDGPAPCRPLGAEQLVLLPDGMNGSSRAGAAAAQKKRHEIAEEGKRRGTCVSPRAALGGKVLVGVAAVVAVARSFLVFGPLADQRPGAGRLRGRRRGRRQCATGRASLARLVPREFSSPA